MKKTFSINIGCIIFFGVILTYSSCFLRSFLFGDDYAWYFASTHYPEVVLRDARPLYALILWSTAKIMGQEDLFHKLQWLRFISVLSLALFSLLEYKIIFMLTRNKMASMLIAFAIVSLPAYQCYAIEANWMSYSISCIPAALSSMVALRESLRPKKIIRGYYTPIIFSGFLMLLSLMIFQSGAMIFWSNLLAYLIFRPVFMKRSATRRFIMQFTCGMTGLFFYFIVFETIRHLPLSIHVAQDRGGFDFHLIDKITWLCKTIWIDCLPMWFQPVRPNSIEHTILSALTIFVIMLNIAIDATILKEIRIKTGSLRLGLLMRSLFIVFLFTLSVLPNMATPIYSAAYRIEVALQTCIVVLFFGPIFQLFIRMDNGIPTYIKNIVISCIAALILLKATYNVENIGIQPQVAEMQHVMVALRSAEQSDIKQVHIVRPYWNEYARPLWTNEIGWSSSASKYVAYPIVKVAYTQLYHKEMKYTVTSSGHDEPIPQGDGILVIDMRQLKDLAL